MIAFQIPSQRYPFVVNEFVPTAMLVVVSWIGFFVPAEMVPGRMALLVTIFLMLVNIANYSAAYRPQTASPTALDAWQADGTRKREMCPK